MRNKNRGVFFALIGVLMIAPLWGLIVEVVNNLDFNGSVYLLSIYFLSVAGYCLIIGGLRVWE